MVTEISSNEISWIANRKYRAKCRDIPNASWRDIFVAISIPRKLLRSERPIDTDFAQYGCTVQTGAEITRHLVVGRDALEAIFHGILVIDTYLMTLSKEQDLQGENGEDFNANIDGLLLGPLASRYNKSIQEKI